ncbi:hypothetical protein [Cryptosporangium japonicum]|uniref:hypothetical protein n=1 Tax=Cryptosporangium japonicum TaxID=80872 RepID=UPI0031D2AB5A
MVLTLFLIQKFAVAFAFSQTFIAITLVVFGRFLYVLRRNCYFDAPSPIVGVPDKLENLVIEEGQWLSLTKGLMAALGQIERGSVATPHRAV